MVKNKLSCIMLFNRPTSSCTTVSCPPNPKLSRNDAQQRFHSYLKLYTLMWYGHVADNIPTFPLHVHRAALIIHQSLKAKLTLKYQIDFPAISTVYLMNILQSICKLL